MAEPGTKPDNDDSHLLEFYGTECVVCHQMEPLIERAKEELKVNVQKFECWHNAANMQYAQKLMADKCMSIPFFYNKKTGDYICGRADYNRVKQWASGKK